jgi:DNA-binding transcriptional LysR family regulator
VNASNINSLHYDVRIDNPAVTSPLIPAQRNIGLAILPRPLGDATRNLAAIDIGESPPGLDTFVGYHQDLRRLSRLRALLELVIERLAN